jgi:hypothetical protein
LFQARAYRGGFQTGEQVAYPQRHRRSPTLSPQLSQISFRWAVLSVSTIRINCRRIKRAAVEIIKEISKLASRRFNDLDEPAARCQYDAFGQSLWLNNQAKIELFRTLRASWEFLFDKRYYTRRKSRVILFIDQIDWSVFYRGSCIKYFGPCNMCIKSDKIPGKARNGWK